MEKTVLTFLPGDPGKRFEWIAYQNGRVAGLCDGQFCFSCNYDERKKLEGFDGGKLEVVLQQQLKTGPFGIKREFFLAHLVSVPQSQPEKMEIGLRAVEGAAEIEFEPTFNTILYLSGQDKILVDPGSMLMNGSKAELIKLITAYRPNIVIITHGHQDHWRNLELLDIEEGVIIYLTPLAYRLILYTAKMEKNTVLQRVLKKCQIINPGDRINLGKAKIYTFGVPHTIPESMGLLIISDKKRVVHLCDFRLGEGVEKAELVTSLRAIAREKVNLLVANIVNAHQENNTTESMVINSLTDILTEAEGRVIVTCFSTNLERIGNIAEIGQAQGRKVFFLGAGMKRAREELSREGLEFEVEDEGDILSDYSLIFVSGCQAEPNSVLQQIIRGENLYFEPRSSDVLVSSARCIPGNEEALRQQYIDLRPKFERVVLNEGEIKRLRIEDLGVEEALTHNSGHAYKKEISSVVNILEPETVFPVPQVGDGFEAFKTMVERKRIKMIKERVVEL